MENEETVKDEVRRISIDFPSQEVHKVPDGYFEKLPGEVLNRWKYYQSDSATKRIQWKRILPIAAIVSGLVIGIGWWQMGKAKIDQPITSAEAFEYIHENIDEFEILLQENAQFEIEGLEGITNEEIHQYILEETDEQNIEDLF